MERIFTHFQNIILQTHRIVEILFYKKIGDINQLQLNLKVSFRSQFGLDRGL